MKRMFSHRSFPFEGQNKTKLMYEQNADTVLPYDDNKNKIYA